MVTGKRTACGLEERSQGVYLDLSQRADRGTAWFAYLAAFRLKRMYIEWLVSNLRVNLSPVMTASWLLDVL